MYYSSPQLSVLTQAACKHAPPANVAAMVNGHPITYTELEKTYQSQYPQQPEAANQDLVMSQKLDLLGNLITNEILLQRAEKLGLTAVDADVDTELNKMKAPYTKEEFDRQIADRHMTLDDLKTQIRQRLTVDKLVNKEITSHVTITDADVANFYNANKANFNLKEPQVHMAQILVTATPDPNVHNLKNSKARNEAEAKSKIEDLEARLKRGEDFALLAQNYSEDPNTAPNGGDMGFITESALERANPELRNMVMSLPPNGDLQSHSHPGRLSHSQGDFQGAERPARPQRSARAAEHSRNPAQRQGPTPEDRVLRDRAQRLEDRELPGAEHSGKRGEGKLKRATSY